MSKKTSETVNAETGEVTETTQPSTPMTISQKAMTLPNGVVVTMVKQVTLPLLKHGDGETVVFTALETMFTGKQLKAKNPGEPLPKRATIVKVLDAKTGQTMQYIVPAVLEDTWKTDYPDNSYVGKAFAIQKLPKVEGKRHKDLIIVEVSLG